MLFFPFPNENMNIDIAPPFNIWKVTLKHIIRHILIQRTNVQNFNEVY